jgi:hypothetical protein
VRRGDVGAARIDDAAALAEPEQVVALWFSLRATARQARGEAWLRDFFCGAACGSSRGVAARERCQESDVETMPWIHSATTHSGTARIEQHAGIKVDGVVPDTVLHTDSLTTPKRGKQGCAQHKQDSMQSAAYIVEQVVRVVEQRHGMGQRHPGKQGGRGLGEGLGLKPPWLGAAALTRSLLLDVWDKEKAGKAP